MPYGVVSLLQPIRLHGLSFYIRTVNRTRIHIQLFQVIQEDLGNAIHEAELGVVLQVLVGYLDVLYKIRKVNGIRSIIPTKPYYTDTQFSILS
jgi:hypothetical protein